MLKIHYFIIANKDLSHTVTYGPPYGYVIQGIPFMPALQFETKEKAEEALNTLHQNIDKMSEFERSVLPNLYVQYVTVSYKKAR